MNNINPQITIIPSSGIWVGRKSVSGMFLKEHDLKENAKAFEVASEEILRNTLPNNLLLLVEGINDSLSKEVLSARNLAEEYKVKVEDPIINPFNSHIAREASVSSIHGALSRLVLDYLTFEGDDLTLARETYTDELIRFSVDAVAKEFGVSPKDLRKEFSLLSFHDSSRLQGEVELLAKLRQKLIDKSNIYSRKNLLEILRRSTEPSFFIMTGGAHELVFKPYFNKSIEKQEPVLSKELKPKPYRRREQFISPSTELVDIQESIKSSGIEILAAACYSYLDPYWSSWDAQYIKCDDLGNNPTRWDKFEDYENDPKFSDFDHSADLIIASMLELVLIHTPKPLKSKLYSQSNLIERALDNPGRLITSEKVRVILKGMFKDTVSNFTNSNSVYLSIKPDDIKTVATKAALTLRIIVEQIGDSLPDEDVIIQKLLSAPVPAARNHGSWAAFHTSKHKWRSNDNVIWSLINAVSNESNPNIKRKVHLAVISANPLFLFVKDKHGNHIIYKGEDSEFENILIACAQESDPKARAYAFGALGTYQELHHINNSQIENVLIRGIENDDENVVFAIVHRLRTSRIADSKVLPFLIKKADDNDPVIRANALFALTRHLDGEKLHRSSDIYSSELFPIARKHLKDAED